jgi:hypothetical protein
MDQIEGDRRGRLLSIETCMMKAAMDGDVERLDDLHIDSIDPEWKSPRLGIQGALTAHQIALRLRDVHGLPLTVVVAFSLKSEPRRVGADFRTLRELETRLDWSPPSLYLFRCGNEPWASDNSYQELAGSLVDHPQPGSRWLYIEFKPNPSDEYHRTVFCAVRIVTLDVTRN